MTEYVVFLEHEFNATRFFSRHIISANSAREAVDRTLNHPPLSNFQGVLRSCEVFASDGGLGIYRLEPQEVKSYEVVLVQPSNSR
jgi:hypothetical protein